MKCSKLQIYILIKEKINVYEMEVPENTVVNIDFDINSKIFDANGPHFNVEKSSSVEKLSGNYEYLLCKTLERGEYFLVSHSSKY